MSGQGWFKKGLLGLMGFEMHLEGGTHSIGLRVAFSLSHQCAGLSPELMASGPGSPGGCFPWSKPLSPSTAGAVLGRGVDKASSSTFISYQPPPTEANSYFLSKAVRPTCPKPVNRSELRALSIIAPLPLPKEFCIIYKIQFLFTYIPSHRTSQLYNDWF